MDKTNAGHFGSDPIAETLRTLGFTYIALTPGASFRGLHDSLVNHLGNADPRMLLCLHEESAVALAHGWTRVTGEPMAVALHSNVGLMHATMAIFNAWCDRVPMLLIGAQGPMDAALRRPWIEWIHTMGDLAGLIRGYTKWDDQPGSVPAAIESLVRARQIATTEPKGPAFVCLDVTIQEERLDAPIDPPDLARFRLPEPAEPPSAQLAEAAALLAKARRPVILMGRVSRKRVHWDERVRLAETLGATVLTDLKNGAVFPTTHPAHPHPPGIFMSAEAGGVLKDSDAILALDWVDLGGTLRQACGGAPPAGKVIHCSVDQYIHRGASMDYQALPVSDLTILASPDRLVGRLLEALAGRRASATPAPRMPNPPAGPESVDGRISVQAMARIVSETLAAHAPSYIRLPLGWPGELCRFEDPLDYIGFDGGGGVGSGPGMAVGAALALRASGRLPVAVLGDGDYLMGLTALWTAVRERIPLLIVVSNNESFFNDELHQERVARARGRPIENRSIGVKLDAPAADLALLARGQGAEGIGPIFEPAELRAALVRAAARVQAGAVCVVDARVAPEYSRAASSGLLRHVPSTPSTEKR